MTLDFLGKTSGTWINVVAILVGTGLGLLMRGRLPEKMQRVITQGVGLTVMVVGVGMANSLGKVQVGRSPGVILGMVAMVIGGLLGEWWLLEDRLEAIGHWLKRKFKGDRGFTEGLVTASLLFCIGPMAVIGSLSNGLNGDNTVLVLKSAIDGLAAIALTSSFGIGVGFSSLPILLYQGGLSLSSGLLTLPNPATAPPVILITGVGGLIIVGTGMNLLEVTKVRLASFLPALPLTLVLYWLAAQLT
jgi:uncharacterized protein